MLLMTFANEEETAKIRPVEIDEACITQIAEGSKEAFSYLYQTAGNAVFAYAFSMLRSREDAEDAMQDTFLKIRSAAHLYEPQGKPLAWIFTITRNICLMKFRKEKRRYETPAEELPIESAGDGIADADVRMMLTAAFRILSEEEFQIILLHAVTGLKHREIAEMAGMPLSTVLSKYNRGLKKLRQELSK